MKNKLIFGAITLAFIGFSCSNQEEQRQREQQIRDSFNTLLSMQTQQSQTLEAQMKDIDENLMKITSNYAELREIAQSEAEFSDDMAKHIKIQIEAIADVLAKDKNRIAALQSQIAKTKSNDKDMQDLLARLSELNIKLAQKSIEITQLSADLESKNVQLDNLADKLKQINQETQTNDVDIAKLEDERYTGYFIVGTKAELKSYGLIDTKGGFIGIGKTTTLATNGDVSMMKKIDVRRITEIPLTGQRIEILTSHPKTSYALQGSPTNPASIVITSTDEFWQASKCLVILVK